jgi:RNA polymerase sigma factor (sigma-70 family)
MADDRTSCVQLNLERLRGGDDRARGELMALARDRLVALTRVMLRDYGRVRRWEQTDDVLQNALIRLDRALKEVPPGSAREFYGLATLQVRRELIDLARRHYGPEGWGARHASGELDGSLDDGRGRPPAPEAPDLTHEPGRLAAWGEFHAQVESLPDDDREAFGLVWYQGLTHAQAAEVVGVSTKTIQRRWHSACLRLHEVMGGDLPGF